jgi:two-component system CheB/CheR fusion protein
LGSCRSAKCRSGCSPYVENEKAITLPAEKIGGDGEHEPDEHEEKAPGAPLVAKQTDDPDDETALREVLAFLRSQTGHDFSHYKRATVLRRIARRLQVNSLETIPAYLDFLRTHAHEASALLRDLLICVTHFFRDPAAFAALEAHIPQLFAGKTPNDQVRVWAPACATGEEAYSIAMLLYEQASRLERPPSIQVFATDLDDEVVRDAREGIYPATIEADVSQERLRRFFFETHGRYRIRKEVRELVLFAEHDLLARLAFFAARSGLVSQLAHLSQAGGAKSGARYFFISPSGRAGCFSSAARRTSMMGVTLPRSTSASVSMRAGPTRGRRWCNSSPARTRSKDQPAVLPRLVTPPAVRELAPFTPAQQRLRSLGELHLGLLEQYAPPSVIVDENYEILHLSDKAGAFLQLPAGEPSANLLKIVLEPLRLELRTAFFPRRARERDSDRPAGATAAEWAHRFR